MINILHASFVMLARQHSSSIFGDCSTVTVFCGAAESSAVFCGAAELLTVFCGAAELLTVLRRHVLHVKISRQPIPPKT